MPCLEIGFIILLVVKLCSGFFVGDDVIAYSHAIFFLKNLQQFKVKFDLTLKQLYHYYNENEKRIMESEEKRVVDIVKRKITKFFNKEDRKTIFNAVNTYHIVAQRTTLLIKLFYLTHKETIIDKEFIDSCIKAVSNVNFKCRKSKNNPDGNTPEIYERVVTVYKHHFQPLKFECKLSLQNTYNYFITQLLTNYNNNVDAHYEKYIKRVILYELCLLRNHDNAHKIPHDIRYDAWLLTNHLLFGHELENTFGLDVIRLRKLCCVERNDQSLELHVTNNRHLYLRKMVDMNEYIEVNFGIIEGVKIFSPLCIRSSMIPTYLRIDTTSLMQLLFDQPRLDQFVKDYELLYGIKLHKLTKANMASNYETMTGLKNTSDYDGAMHATRIWQYLCNFNNKKFREILVQKRKDGTWVFDNMIQTDGYSIDFQMTPITNFKRHNLFENKCKKKTKKELANIKNDEFRKIEEIERNEETLYLGGDPGKGVLLCLNDGFKTLKYSSGQRNTDTLKKQRMAQNLQYRKKYDVHDYECEILSKISKKSCILSKFIEYLKLREKYELQALLVYRRPIFRQHKFLAHTLRKSSIAKFVNKIEPTFLREETVNTKRKKWMNDHQSTQPIFDNVKNKKTKIAILYGNWGKSTNLRNNDPTPGVGLRRLIHKKIETVTVPEHYTSKTCPYCRTKTLEHAKLTQQQPHTEKFVSEKHHLLRCKNDCVSSWWHRDVAGSFNILLRGLNSFKSKS